MRVVVAFTVDDGLAPEYVADAVELELRCMAPRIESAVLICVGDIEAQVDGRTPETVYHRFRYSDGEHDGGVAQIGPRS